MASNIRGLFLPQQIKITVGPQRRVDPNKSLLSTGKKNSSDVFAQKSESRPRQWVDWFRSFLQTTPELNRKSHPR
jgi:hypothetical protein